MNQNQNEFKGQPFRPSLKQNRDKEILDTLPPDHIRDNWYPNRNVRNKNNVPCYERLIPRGGY